MRICDLRRPHKNGTDDSTIYIVGTGPSLRVFPMDYLQHAPVILLNQAWRYFQDFECLTRISLTVHPELYVDYAKEVPASKNVGMQWVIKKKPPMDYLTLDDPDVFVFTSSTDRKTLQAHPPDTLYLGEGIQGTAMDLACRLGYRTIIMVGCDATSLGGDFHGHDQHVRWLGQDPQDQYALYRRNTADVRRELQETFGVRVLTLSPFIGCGHAEEDYQRLCLERGLAPLPRPKDISPYQRKK